MTPSDITRKGIINQGGFFSPYYLFDLLSRQHADELDPEGREANRRLLRKPFRAAWAKYGESGSTASQAWTAWQRELFEALGFLGGGADEQGHEDSVPLRPLATPIETPRHGLVPIARAAYLTTADGRPPTADSDSRTTHYAPRSPTTDPHPPSLDSPLVFIDLHGFGTDLDRDTYPQSLTSHLQSPITEESIARAIEFALDSSQTRWAIIAAGDKLRLYRKGGSVARQYLEVNFPALFDADRDDEWAAFWGLFRYQAFVPDPASGKCLLDRVLEASQRHAARIADDLRENIVLAVEALIQGILDDPANRAIVQPSSPSSVQQLFTESLYFLYRLLFILYAESRDLLPVGESPIYRDTYSVEHLREMAERPLPTEDTDKTYYIETLRTLFKMLQQGFPTTFEPEPDNENRKSARGAHSEIVNPKSAPFTIPPYNGQLFDPDRTQLLDQCRIPDRAMRQVIRELSLSRPQRRSDRRERYSYADLGVDQLGSIYEGLLVYEPAIVSEETVVARVKGEERLVSRAQAEQYGLPIIEGSAKHPGSFVLRLWGGRRKGSGSYYTPQEITSFLIKAALEPLVEPIVQGCALEQGSRGAGEQRRKRPKYNPDDIFEIKVCDPAMGSGAFLIQACRYLAEAYGRARIAAGLDEDSRMSQAEFARYKRRVAEKCLYGVDLNPLAVELAKVSLWLETLAIDRPLTFLDAHLRCGNSLIGAPLRDENGVFTVERLSAIPDAALQEVSKEASKAQKEAARKRIQRNREEQKRLQGTKGFAGTLPGVDWGVLSLREIETALADTLTRRLDLEASDEELPLPQAVALVHQKEDQFTHLQRDAASRYRQARQICDLWGAVWFWPEPGSEVTVRRGGEGPLTVTVPEPPTTQVYLELVGGILGTDPGSLSNDERAAYLATAQHVAEQQRFFHWELEFPEVWREKNGQVKKNGGFDAIAGNPPWDVVQPLYREFWSNYDPFFRDLKKSEASKLVSAFRSNLEMDFLWRQYELAFSQQNNYFKYSGVYQHLGLGKNDTYKLFVEKNHGLLCRGGGLGLVLPSGFYTDLGSRELRKLLFETCQVKYLLALTNERFIFPSVHHAFRFVLLILRRGGNTNTLHPVFRLNVQNAVAPDELAWLLASLESETLELKVSDIRRFSPDSLSLMEFKTQRDIDISSTIYEGTALLGEIKSDSWNLRFTQELNMTSDNRLFRTEEDLEESGLQNGINEVRVVSGETYLPLYEGKSIWQFDTNYAPPRYWVSLKDANFRLNPEKSFQLVRLAYRLIQNSQNERTLVASVFSPNSLFGNSLAASTAVDIPEKTYPNSCQLLFIASILNSFSLDFVQRMKTNANLNMFYVYQLPVPRLEEDNFYFDEIVARAVRLICIIPKFADLWNEVAQHYSKYMPPLWQPNYAAIDPGERAQLRAEIDAQVADLYGLSGKHPVK